MIITGPDIANVLGAWVRHSHNPSPWRWKVFMQVTAYMIATKEVNLMFVRDFGQKLSENADADFSAASNDEVTYTKA